MSLSRWTPLALLLIAVGIVAFIAKYTMGRGVEILAYVGGMAIAALLTGLLSSRTRRTKAPGIDALAVFGGACVGLGGAVFVTQALEGHSAPLGLGAGGLFVLVGVALVARSGR